MENSNHIGEARLRVRYAETDQMGVVYHANFIIWFEVGRVEFLRQLGFEYRLMEQEDDCHIAVAEVRCRFKAPARYDDQIFVRTRIKHFRSPLIQFEYEIYHEPSQTLLAEGESTHIVVNSKFEKTTLPAKYVEAFERALIQQNEAQQNGE